MVSGPITALELTSGESNPVSFNTGQFPYAGLYVSKLTVSDIGKRTGYFMARSSVSKNHCHISLKSGSSCL